MHMIYSAYRHVQTHTQTQTHTCGYMDGWTEGRTDGWMDRPPRSLLHDQLQDLRKAMVFVADVTNMRWSCPNRGRLYTSTRPFERDEDFSNSGFGITIFSDQANSFVTSFFFVWGVTTQHEITHVFILVIGWSQKNRRLQQGGLWRSAEEQQTSEASREALEVDLEKAVRQQNHATSRLSRWVLGTPVNLRKFMVLLWYLKLFLWEYSRTSDIAESGFTPSLPFFIYLWFFHSVVLSNP